MNNIVDAIAYFTPEQGKWIPLEGLLAQIDWSSLSAGDCLRLCLLFERYPEEDNEVLWGLLHGIEDIPGSNESVIASVQRRPSLMTVLMLNRMINAGQIQSAGVDLLDHIRSVATDSVVPEAIRSRAQRFIDYQMKKN